MTELHHLIEGGEVVTNTFDPPKIKLIDDGKVPYLIPDNGIQMINHDDIDAFVPPMTKHGMTKHDLTTPLQRLMQYAVHGDTHTATIVVEQSIELRFTPFEGEDPYDALRRVIRNCGYEPVRHSEPRRR